MPTLNTGTQIRENNIRPQFNVRQLTEKLMLCLPLVAITGITLNRRRRWRTADNHAII